MLPVTLRALVPAAVPAPAGITAAVVIVIVTILITIVVSSSSNTHPGRSRGGLVWVQQHAGQLRRCCRG